MELCAPAYLYVSLTPRVLLGAAKVGRREVLTGTSDRHPDTTSMTRLDSAPCTRDNCYDWLDWSLHGATNRIPWGEPYTPGP